MDGWMGGRGWGWLGAPEEVVLEADFAGAHGPAHAVVAPLQHEVRPRHHGAQHCRVVRGAVDRQADP